MENTEENKRLHLEFVQNVITRMGTNSFQIKGWAITIVAALLAVYSANSKIVLVPVAIASTGLFWLLDAYYLQLERKYRALYNDLAGITAPAKPVQLYNMNIKDYKGGNLRFFSSLISPSIVWLYSLIIVVLIILLCHE